MPGIFNGLQFVLEMGSSTPYKEKRALKELIIQHGGVLSYILTKQTNYVVTNDKNKATGSYRCQQACKRNILIVSTDFIQRSVQHGHLVNIQSYMLGESQSDKEFSCGKITGKPQESKISKEARRKKMELTSVQRWSPQDPNCPDFSGNLSLVKFTVFKSTAEKNGPQFVAIEIHHSDLQRSYRIMVHQMLSTGSEKQKSMFEYMFLDKPDDCISVYEALYTKFKGHPYNMKVVSPQNEVVKGLGSRMLQTYYEEHGSSRLDHRVSSLVSAVWQDAVGSLDEVLVVKPTSISIEQVDQAECVIQQIRGSLRQPGGCDMSALSEEFYTSILHKNPHRQAVDTLKMVAQKLDLCQLLRDVLAVSEATNWSPNISPLAKYKALHCHLEVLEETSSDYQLCRDLVNNTSDQKLTIHNIYRVARLDETQDFHDVGNSSLLFHSSKSENFVGILSRGLLPPKLVVEDYGGSRSDIGMLGAGMYFADSASTSMKYSTPSRVSLKRYLLLNKVSLGSCWQTNKRHPDLVQPPPDHNSVQGIKGSPQQPSEFEANEYVIYNTSQQKLQYLIEFSQPGDILVHKEVHTTDEQIMQDQEYTWQNFNPEDIEQLKLKKDPLSKVKAGLLSQSDVPVPLRSVHIRAKLMDLAAQTVVLQEYYNHNNTPIEAKYVFPLEENAVVCGFEAFINDKHIVGIVKEKEQAHREYREAISKGHGAYLMDEELPDVFTVSVGNLPPKCRVLIKITYVSELAIEADKILFSVPSTVAPWQQDTLLSQITQDVLAASRMSAPAECLTLQVAIEMPFVIRSVECPTHKIRQKWTDTKAVVELMKNSQLNEGFQLLIALAEIHVPRMWVELHPDGTQACMLTFYPEFEFERKEVTEIIFMLDASNSMRGTAIDDAKMVLLLALDTLPDDYMFNIISFGSTFTELFPAPQNKSTTNIISAIDFVRNVQANHGNTHVLDPLTSLYLLPSGGQERNIFLISDGHMTNAGLLLQKVKHQRHVNRLFTLGISSVVNHHMMRSLARAGSGLYEHYSSSNKSGWMKKISIQLSLSCQPDLTSVSVQWHQGDTYAPPPEQAPALITSLFSGSRLVVYGMVPHCLQATLKAEVQGQEVSTMVSTHELQQTRGTMLHQLTARALIRDWEEGLLHTDKVEHMTLKKSRKNQIIQLSKKYSIITKFTSFVAIEERQQGETIQSGPSVSELIEKESVDMLPYISWQSQPGLCEKLPEARGWMETPLPVTHPEMEKDSTHEEEEKDILKTEDLLLSTESAEMSDLPAPSHVQEKGELSQPSDGTVALYTGFTAKPQMTGLPERVPNYNVSQVASAQKKAGARTRQTARRSAPVRQTEQMAATEISSQIQQVSDLIKSSITKVLDRGEKLFELEAKGSDLSATAKHFYKFKSKMSSQTKEVSGVVKTSSADQEQKLLELDDTSADLSMVTQDTGEKLSELEDKSSDLSATAKHFYKSKSALQAESEKVSLAPRRARKRQTARMSAPQGIMEQANVVSLDEAAEEELSVLSEVIESSQVCINQELSAFPDTNKVRQLSAAAQHYTTSAASCTAADMVQEAESQAMDKLSQEESTKNKEVHAILEDCKRMALSQEKKRSKESTLIRDIDKFNRYRCLTVSPLHHRKMEETEMKTKEIQEIVEATRTLCHKANRLETSVPELQERGFPEDLVTDLHTNRIQLLKKIWKPEVSELANLDLDFLFNLQTSEGFWPLTTRTADLLQIKKDVLLKQITLFGAKSLGKTCFDDLARAWMTTTSLLITFILLFHESEKIMDFIRMDQYTVCGLSMSYKVEGQSGHIQLYHNGNEEFCFYTSRKVVLGVVAASDWLRKVDAKYPGVYSTLGLAASKKELACLVITSLKEVAEESL